MTRRSALPTFEMSIPERVNRQFRSYLEHGRFHSRSPMHLPSFLFAISRREVRKLCALPSSRNLSGNPSMRILNVAEKNDAAKNIAYLLSGGAVTRREGLSSFNKIYEFECQVLGQNAKMIMTSVRGHILEYDFASFYRNWNNNPISLFEAPISKNAKSDCLQIKKTLENEVKKCSKLIIWTDCDREGENIGFEVIEVCKGAKRNIEIYRATFSEITTQSVKRALLNLAVPNKYVSNAVDVRSELDLRIGAAFTRFQTLYLRKAFPSALEGNLVSFGSCQFPTLGFVIERFKAISEFKPETFWKINVQHMINELSVDFHWSRSKLFSKLACEVLYDKCVECGTAKVENIQSKPKIKWRPKPLDTVELQKAASKLFNLSAKETLKIAENLYTGGFISYPRTETNRFSNDIDLVSLVGLQRDDAQWGEFAQRVLRKGPDPFQGNKSDQAHPPIHPTKHTNELSGNNKQVYEYIVRRFLACLSSHAEGLETIVDIDIADEKFSARGLMITARNYLEVFPYEKWSDKEIHSYLKGDIFKPEISMEEGETTPPPLLTEADLIALMDKHGIGTDATHAEHIETIKARLYVGLQDDKYFVPRTLGMGLVEGYTNMGYAMAKPKMRAELEADLKRICEREKSPAEVLATHIQKYKTVFEGVQRQMSHLSTAIQNYIQVEAVPVAVGDVVGKTPEQVGRCPSCHLELTLRQTKNGKKFIGCSGYPQCRIALWLPSFVLNVTATKDPCPSCGPGHYLIRFKFQKGSCYFPPDYVGCIGGCDPNLLEILNCNRNAPPPPSTTTTTTTRTRTGTTTMTGTRTGTTTTRTRPRMTTATLSSLREITDDSTNGGSSGRLPPDDSPPNCHCGVSAGSATVKKAGPNHGKEFYRCGAVTGSRCDFFKWKTPVPGKRKPRGEAEGATDSAEDMRCYCSLRCRRVVSTKNGPNEGRTFLSCGKSFHSQDKCSFFKWADEDDVRPEVTGERRRGNNW